MRTNQKTFTLVEGALCVALAVALTYLKIPLGAQGGSFDFAMIPLIIFAVDRGGLKWGTLSGVVFGLLHFLFTSGFALNWQSIILDYIVAFGVIGLAGLFRSEKSGIKAYLFGAIIACLARFLVHFVSGVTIYLDYFEPVYQGFNTPAPWIYSAVYNGFYMLPNTIAAVILCPVIGAALQRTKTKNK